MRADTDTMAIRALNYWRKYYMPTYLGLRLLLRQLPKDMSSGFLLEYVFRKVAERAVPRYKGFLRYKSLDSSGGVEHRHFFASSPTSALAEAFALHFMSELPTLADIPNVYSYRWPRSGRSGSHFSYFLDGYLARNRQVAVRLSSNPDWSVLVFDVKQFYPSVDQERLRERLYQHLNNVSQETVKKLISSICEQVLAVVDKGIPIGPPISSVFGNLALQVVDEKAGRETGADYLRYVDDMIIVCPQSRASEFQSKLLEWLSAEGLEVQEEKCDQLTGSDWRESSPTSEEESLAVSFQELIERIRMYLWWRPTQLSQLQDAFRNHGISLPLRRFAIDAQYGRLQHFIKGKLLSGSRRRLVRHLLSESVDSLVASALRVRRDFYSVAENMGERCPLPLPGMTRRRWIQRMRFLLNRLLYLSGADDYGLLMELAPDIREFYEYRQLVKALSTYNSDHVVGSTWPSRVRVC